MVRPRAPSTSRPSSRTAAPPRSSLARSITASMRCHRPACNCGARSLVHACSMPILSRSIRIRPWRKYRRMPGLPLVPHRAHSTSSRWTEFSGMPAGTITSNDTAIRRPAPKMGQARDQRGLGDAAPAGARRRLEHAAAPARIGHHRNLPVNQLAKIPDSARAALGAEACVEIVGKCDGARRFGGLRAPTGLSVARGRRVAAHRQRQRGQGGERGAGGGAGHDGLFCGVHCA